MEIHAHKIHKLLEYILLYVVKLHKLFSFMTVLLLVNSTKEKPLESI